MKIIFLIVAIVAGAWWYFVGGRNLSDEDVHAFYRSYEAALLERNPEDLCGLLASEFESRSEVVVAGVSQPNRQTKAQTCQSYRDMYAAWEKLGEKMGGTLQLDSNYVVSNVMIEPGGKSATAEIVSSLDVAGTIMNIKSRSKDTLIRKNGKVLLLRSEGSGSIGSGG